MAKLDLRRTADSSVEAVYRARALAEEAEPRRGHLGASQLGQECDRALWYGFRWVFHPAGAATPEAIELARPERGRMLRLFDHGKLIEAHVMTGLRAAGYDIEEQVSFDFGGGVSGTADGIISGLPEAPTTGHLLEIKSSNSKQFAKLEKEGMQQAKPVHWVQLQLGMLGLGLERAYYIACNKDTDHLYAERIVFDKSAAEMAVERGKRIIKLNAPPQRIGDATSFACQWCDWRDGCHGRVVPSRNCRTCVSWSNPGQCSLLGRDVTSIEAQGCRQHRYLPGLLHWLTAVDGKDERFVTYDTGYTDDGEVVP